MIQRESPSKSRASTARFRLVIAGIAAAFILPIASLMSIPFLISKPLAVIRPAAAPTTLSDDAGNSALARIQIDRVGSFTLDLILSRVRDEMPRVEMRMPEHGIAALPRTVHAISPGSFQIEGQFAMPGRWQIAVDYAGSSQVFEFIVGGY